MAAILQSTTATIVQRRGRMTPAPNVQYKSKQKPRLMTASDNVAFVCRSMPKRRSPSAIMSAGSRRNRICRVSLRCSVDASLHVVRALGASTTDGERVSVVGVLQPPFTLLRA